MAFVLVLYLDPGHVSQLNEILLRSTAIPVAEALDQVAVVPNQVYTKFSISPHPAGDGW